MKEVRLTRDERRLVRMLSALGNPLRFRMLSYLAACPQCQVGDVVEQVPLAQSTVSEHLKILRDAGLVHDERAGTAKCCTLDRESLRWLAEEIAALAEGGETCGRHRG
jgi:ArsR family transcriptional regulator